MCGDHTLVTVVTNEKRKLTSEWWKKGHECALRVLLCKFTESHTKHRHS